MAQARNTDEQLQQAIDAVIAHGSISAAARALGIPRTTVQCRYGLAKDKGFKSEVQPLLAAQSAAPPEGYKLKGTSTLYDGDGVARLQWVKTDAATKQLEEMQRAAFKALCEELKPLPVIRTPRGQEKDLVNLYTITDAHVGALAWDKESGENCWQRNILDQ